MMHEQEQRRRAAQKRVEDRRKRLVDVDSIRTPSSRWGITKARTMQVGSGSSQAQPQRRGRAHSFSSNLRKLSLLNTSPTFDYPQPSHPQSAREKTLSQELALCDFRAYLLAMEVQNRERLRQARTNEWVAYGVDESSPIDEDELLRAREKEMAVQAEELTRKRLELQEKLEEVTGRDYPLPDTYGHGGDDEEQVVPVSQASSRLSSWFHVT